MNRKNLTAAVLAGLAGAAGLAGTAQAVNLNPDGLGQVLIYPYYTANSGNTTFLSVVNTTDSAKAVKVRFMEGFNSREVLDFNLYMSHHDVWVATVADGTGVAELEDLIEEDYETSTFLLIPDDSCTVPYLYEDKYVELDGGFKGGAQPFLDLRFTGKLNDGGPDSQARVNEGHFEIIEMGTIVADSPTEADITHKLHKPKDEPSYWAPGDCEQLVENWSEGGTGETDGIWFTESGGPGGQAYTDTARNSGGLFGGAAVINPAAGTMFSYDAKAIQGFDKTDDGLHYFPGDRNPSLNSGDQMTAWVFFGVPQNQAVPLTYGTGVDAVSAVFMHEFTMNEYSTEGIANGATEWIITFPTKSFYADPLNVALETGTTWRPSLSSGATGAPLASCQLWEPGQTYPTIIENNGDGTNLGPTGAKINDYCGEGTLGDFCGPFNNVGYEECEYTAIPFNLDGKARPPFTQLYGEDKCEVVELVSYDRDERTYKEFVGGNPPVVSPRPPGSIVPPDVFQLCNEVNILRFGDRSVFNSLADLDGDSLVLDVSKLEDRTQGWAWIDFGYDADHIDDIGMVGLPVTGFSAYQFQNDFTETPDGSLYGGLFQHKGNVRKVGVTRSAD